MSITFCIQLYTFHFFHFKSTSPAPVVKTSCFGGQCPHGLHETGLSQAPASNRFIVQIYQTGFFQNCIVSQIFEVILQRIQCTGSVFSSECRLDQSVGEGRIFGQDGAMAVGAEGVAIPHPLGFVLTVVSVSFQYFPNGRTPLPSQVRPLWFSNPITVLPPDTSPRRKA